VSASQLGEPALAELTVEVRPAWPYRLRRGGGRDGVLRPTRGGGVIRSLRVDGEPVIVGAWQPGRERIVLRARGGGDLERAIDRMRFALGVDDDLGEFYATFKRDPLLGPAIRARPWHRPRRRPWAWEALAWAITEQLIESSRAAQIQRRIVRRWGPRDPAGELTLRDVPDAGLIAGRAPAELAATDISPARALAMIRCAREVASGRVDPGSADDDPRLLRVPEIGPWTIQCLGLHGRGDPDSLPAGDLAYVKLVGRLAGLGRRATVAEVEEFFAPYAPFRGLAGSFVLAHSHRGIASVRPLRAAA